MIVLTYAVNKPASLAYLRTNLLPSLRMAHVAVPMILVGCMQDTVAQQPQSLESEIGTSRLPHLTLSHSKGSHRGSAVSSWGFFRGAVAFSRRLSAHASASAPRVRTSESSERCSGQGGWKMEFSNGGWTLTCYVGGHARSAHDE